MTDDRNRESFEPTVTAMIASAEGMREPTLQLLSFLAMLLEGDALPKSGRAYLAAMLQTMAKGRDPRPRAKKKRGTSAVRIALEAARQAEKIEAAKSDMAKVYKTLAIKISKASRAGDTLNKSTVEKEASKGRKHIKENLADHIASGYTEAKFIKVLAETEGLKVESVRRYLLNRWKE